MAKINEETIRIIISSIHREGEDPRSGLTPDLIENIEAVVSQLVGDSFVVEVKYE